MFCLEYIFVKGLKARGRRFLSLVSVFCHSFLRFVTHFCVLSLISWFLGYILAIFALLLLKVECHSFLRFVTHFLVSRVCLYGCPLYFVKPFPKVEKNTSRTNVDQIVPRFHSATRDSRVHARFHGSPDKFLN
jgi:membrane-bound metal-dependent hydrolase YbcI (DUF457 family)